MVTVATVKSKATTTTGSVGSVKVEIIWVLVRQEILAEVRGTVTIPTSRQVHFVTASGEEIILCV